MCGNRRDQIVTLKTDCIDHGYTKGNEQLFDDVKLLIQNIGLLFTLSLVLGNCFVSECLFTTIEHHDHTIRLMVFYQRIEHCAESVHRVSHLSCRSCHVGRQSKEGSIRQRVAVESHQLHNAETFTNRE